MTDMLGKSNQSLNDDLFTQQASLIDKIQRKSFNDSRNQLFDAIASLQLVVRIVSSHNTIIYVMNNQTQVSR